MQNTVPNWFVRDLPIVVFQDEFFDGYIVVSISVGPDPVEHQFLVA